VTTLAGNPSRPILIVIGFWVFAVFSILGIGFDLYIVYATGELSGNVTFGLAYWLAKGALALLVWLRFGWARWGLLIVHFSTSIGTATLEFMKGNEASIVTLLLETTAGNWVFLLQAVALAILFLPASNRWLKGARYAVT
jgi:hypothetical protein